MGIRIGFGGSGGGSVEAAPETPFAWPSILSLTSPTPGWLCQGGTAFAGSTPPTVITPNGNAALPGGSSPLGALMRYNFPVNGGLDPNTTVGMAVNPQLVSYRSATKLGGFRARIYFGFGVNSPANLTGKRFFVGIADQATLDIVTNPSARTNLIGVCRDSTDTDLHFLSRGVGGAMKTIIGGLGGTGDQNILYQLDIVNGGQDSFSMSLTRVSTTLIVPAVTVDVPVVNVPTFGGTVNAGEVGWVMNPLNTAPVANFLIGGVYGAKYLGQTVP